MLTCSVKRFEWSIDLRSTIINAVNIPVHLQTLTPSCIQHNHNHKLFSLSANIIWIVRIGFTFSHSSLWMLSPPAISDQNKTNSQATLQAVVRLKYTDVWKERTLSALALFSAIMSLPQTASGLCLGLYCRNNCHSKDVRRKTGRISPWELFLSRGEAGREREDSRGRSALVRFAGGGAPAHRQHH